MRIADLLQAGETRSARYHDAVDSADARDVEAVLLLLDAKSAQVRGEAVNTLPLLLHGGTPEPDVVERVVRLTVDPDRRVRDLACFVLAEQWREIDTPDLRDALAARMDDLDRDARSEALVGLAYRGDARALPRVHEALSRPSGIVWKLEMVAAGALSDPSLHELVVRHQAGWTDPSSAATADAVRRLTDAAGPGNDLLDGLAELCRRRSRDEPDDTSLRWWLVLIELLEIAPQRTDEFFELVRARLGSDGDALAQLDGLRRLA